MGWCSVTAVALAPSGNPSLTSWRKTMWTPRGPASAGCFLFWRGFVLWWKGCLGEDHAPIVLAGGKRAFVGLLGDDPKSESRSIRGHNHIAAIAIIRCHSRIGNSPPLILRRSATWGDETLVYARVLINLWIFQVISASCLGINAPASPYVFESVGSIHVRNMGGEGCERDKGCKGAMGEVLFEQRRLWPGNCFWRIPYLSSVLFRRACSSPRKTFATFDAFRGNQSSRSRGSFRFGEVRGFAFLIFCTIERRGCKNSFS